MIFGVRVARLYAWDRGLNFRAERRRLVKLIKSEGMGSSRSVRRVAYFSVLLIQLSNGLRISEAVDAALAWAGSGRREVRVAVRKRRDPYERLVVIPKELGARGRAAVATLLNEDSGKLVVRLKTFCRAALGYNTHALRYAFISYMGLEKKLPAQLIAKMTGHKKLDHILHYTEKELAEEVLRAVAG